MPNKEGKSRPSAKSEKNEKKDVPEKQPPSKHPVEKGTEKPIRDVEALKEARELVLLLESALVGVRAQIESERREGISDPSVLQAQVNRAKAGWERIRSDLSQAKDLSRKRKDEIDGWKTWYAARSKEQKPVELQRRQREAALESLQREIKWRADELAANGEKINTLIPQEFEAQGVFEMANQKLAALQAGVHKRPIEEDPRLKSVQAELKQAVAAVEQLEKKRPNPK